jgi:predicted ATPase
MFSRIEAENYRCLKTLAVDLSPYQILVGPNASGKSTMLDVIRFFSDLVAVGPRSAANERSENFQDLVWGRAGWSFRLAIESKSSELLPGVRPERLETLRYEIGIKLDPGSDIVFLHHEMLTLRGPSGGNVTVLDRTEHQVRYRSEVEGSEFSVEFALGPTQSGLANLPMDQTKFPVTTQFKNSLLSGMQMVVLDNEMLRGSSPPGQGEPNLFDGLNLPRRIARLREFFPNDFASWIRHIRTALPDIETIKTVLRPEDQNRYLMIRYKNGIEVPAWMVSDGTLRLIALTLLAYVPEATGVYLIEEPEVGVHPSAFETIVQSLSSIYYGQVILTTHAPLLVRLSKPENLLCFSKNEDGTQVIRGNDHPLLQSWQSKVEIGDLFAAGVLGKPEPSGRLRCSKNWRSTSMCRTVEIAPSESSY